MTYRNCISLLALSISLCVALVPAIAHAAPIVFQHAGSGSGTLNGVPFFNSPFVITAFGDTSQVVYAYPGNPAVSVWYIDHTSAQIQIGGVGTYSFFTPTRTFVNNKVDPPEPGIVGFSRAGNSGLDLFNGPQDALFDTWTATTSIGPVTGNGHLGQWNNSPVVTTGGVLEFNANEIVPTTFIATVIPEPTAATIGLGLLTPLTLVRRRRQAA